MRCSLGSVLGLLSVLSLACSDNDGRSSASASAGTTLPTTSPTGASSFGTDTAPTGSGTGSAGTTDEPTAGSGSGAAGTGTSEPASTGTTGPVDDTDGGGSTTTTTTGVTTNNTTFPNTTGAPPDCVTSLKATIRDFKIEHPDFENFTGNAATKGLVLQNLGPDQKPIHAAAGPTSQTSGPENFLHWYNNTPGVNVAFEIEIPLTEVMPGQFTYQNNAFFPIDNQGWGNEGNVHNFHFTTEIHTEFTYQGGEVFTFTGDDDLWLFINGKLAIDLGGLHPSLSDSIDLDANAGFLGIQLGGTYSMDIFHAERHTDQSNFRIDTSIQCFVIPG